MWHLLGTAWTMVPSKSFNAMRRSRQCSWAKKGAVETWWWVLVICYSCFCRLQCLERLLRAFSTPNYRRIIWSAGQSQTGQEVNECVWDTVQHWPLDWGSCRACGFPGQSWAPPVLHYWHPVQEPAWWGQVRDTFPVAFLGGKCWHFLWHTNPTHLQHSSECSQQGSPLHFSPVAKGLFFAACFCRFMWLRSTSSRSWGICCGLCLRWLLLSGHKSLHPSSLLMLCGRGRLSALAESRSSHTRHTSF